MNKNAVINVGLAALAAFVGGVAVAFLAVPSGTAFTSAAAVAVLYGGLRALASFVATKTGNTIPVDKPSE